MQPATLNNWVLQGLLLSPALGIAVTILPVFFINRMGIPVKDFGGVLLPALALMSVVLLALNRPVFPIKRLLPYIGILVGALVLVGRPMFSYGFDWLSFSNDDMANYCLAAQRFLNHGYFDQPNLDDLVNGKDYSQAYWFMHAAGGVRSGSELMLAVVWAFSGLNAHQIFMPVIMALHLALIAGTGAMVVGVGKARRTPLIAMGLLAISPLTSLGTLYQLIGQVGGLALLTAGITLTYRPVCFKNIFALVRGSVPAAFIFASIFVWYPEVLPFFGLGWIVYSLLMLIFSWQSARLLVKPAIVVGILVLIALNKYVISAMTFMLEQAAGGMQSADVSSVLFPYFLVPSGIAAFWGLIPIAGDIHEPFVSFGIAGGLILFFWLGRYVLPKQIKRADAPISVLLVMITIGLLLFYRNNDFGLFKLAMFAQPFLMGVLAIELGRMRWGQAPRYAKTTLPAIFLPLAISQYGYVGKSTGEEFGGLNEIPHASALKVNRQFEGLIKSLPKKEGTFPVLAIATSNIVLAKLQSLYTTGLPIFFMSRNFYGEKQSPIYSYIRKNEDLKKAESAKQYIKSEIGENGFDLLKPGLIPNKDFLLIYTSIDDEIFNKYKKILSDGTYFNYAKSPENWLVFHHSKLGNHYYLGDREFISFYQLESDPMFPGQKFSSLGRFILLEAMNPSNQPRMVMELTSTVAKQFGGELPQPRVENSMMNFVGRGSGRVVSEPLIPSKADGSTYVSIDIGRDGKQFPSAAKGLMMLYGRSIPADQRRITAFGRDISLISEEQYQAIKPPANLQSFPADLANKNLEYSGIYEDGWISEKSFFFLSPSATSKFITVTGSVPQIDDPAFSTVLKMSVNGKEIASKSLGLGNFEFKVPVTSQVSKQRIELAFSKYQTLPGADGRIAPAKINFIGFE
ncbi:MAG: hypothetical protein NTZ96_13645 [Burkholderiales bacterium]|nr:hypothetical protein [Burkholderiales bacterium]